MEKWGSGGAVLEHRKPWGCGCPSLMPAGLVSQLTGPTGAGFQRKGPTVWVLAARSPGPGSQTANCRVWVSAGRPLIFLLIRSSPRHHTVAPAQTGADAGE